MTGLDNTRQDHIVGEDRPCPKSAGSEGWNIYLASNIWRLLFFFFWGGGGGGVTAERQNPFTSITKEKCVVGVCLKIQKLGVRSILETDRHTHAHTHAHKHTHTDTHIGELHFTASEWVRRWFFRTRDGWFVILTLKSNVWNHALFGGVCIDVGPPGPLCLWPPKSLERSCTNTLSL